MERERDKERGEGEEENDKDSERGNVLYTSYLATRNTTLLAYL